MAAIDKAIYYLNIKPRTRQQVIQYLQKKEFPEDEIREAVRELEEYHYIDDRNYCQLYFEMGFEKGRGIGRIKRELAEKGIDADIIDDVLSEMETVPDQREMALEAGRRILQEAGYTAAPGEDLPAMDYQTKQKLKAKLCRRLASKGFAADVVYGVARELLD